MNLASPAIQQAIIDLAASSESDAVSDACKLVIDDYLNHDETEIDSPREVILIALEAMQLADEATDAKEAE